MAIAGVVGWLLAALVVLSGCGDRAPWELIAAIPLVGVFGFALGAAIGVSHEKYMAARRLRRELEGEGVKLPDLWTGKGGAL